MAITVESLLTQSALPLPVVLLFVIIALTLAFTRVSTQLHYNQTLKKYSQSIISEKHPSHQPQLVPPPQLPYNIPFLGNAFNFLVPIPGAFWKYLVRNFPVAAGSCSLLMGGKKMHILFSPSAINAVLKDKHLGRDAINRELAVTIFDLSPEDSNNYWEDPYAQEKILKEYVVKTERVNELTTNFMRFLFERLVVDEAKPLATNINLYDWMHERVFHASTTALLGGQLLTMFPDFSSEYEKFDCEALSFFFQIPKIFIRKAHARRQKLLEQLAAWNTAMLAQCGGSEGIDPQSEDAWDPLFGSRVNRARQIYYADKGMAMHSRAGMDLGFIFALSSNSITAAGWMLMHILDPEDKTKVKERIMEELRSSENEDGSLHMATLMSQPLLQSIWQEVLRLYSDTITTRDVYHETQLPLDGKDDRKVVLDKGIIMIPSWISHRDPKDWHNPETFHAERFLGRDPQTGKEIFTLSAATGKLIPFGGGRMMCPGRVFAKQEVLAAVAMILLKFEFEVKGFVDEKGRKANGFPGLRRGFLGSSVMLPGGDLVVDVRPRTGK